MTLPVLSLMIFTPVAAGLLLLTVPLGKTAARVVGLAVSLLVAAIGLTLFFSFDGTAVDPVLVEKYSLIPSLGIDYSLAVDGISLLVLLLAALLFPLVYLLFPLKEKGYYGNLLIVQGTMIGAAAAADLALFYVFWELMLLPIFFMIGLYGGPGRIGATVKITVYTIAGSLLMLASIIYLGVEFHARTGYWSFNMTELATLSLSGSGAVLAFAGFIAALAIKIPIFPFHTWLPDAYTEAPTGTTFVLSAVMAKIGVYAVIRIVIPVFPEGVADYGLMLAFAGVIGMMYCGLAALAQQDFKRLLAFSSASHMGIISLGIFCLNSQALTGTIYLVAAHATSTGLLFLLLGIVEERLGTRNIKELGGLAYQAPIFALFFGIAMLASVGLPGTSGFIGEFLIILGALKRHPALGILAGTTLIIGVCYMLLLFQRIFLERKNPLTSSFRDLSPVQTLALLPVILLILIMGVYPQPFIAKIEPAVQQYLTAASIRTEPVTAGAVRNEPTPGTQLSLRAGDL